MRCRAYKEFVLRCLAATNVSKRNVFWCFRKRLLPICFSCLGRSSLDMFCSRFLFRLPSFRNFMFAPDRVVFHHAWNQGKFNCTMFFAQWRLRTFSKATVCKLPACSWILVLGDLKQQTDTNDNCLRSTSKGASLPLAIIPERSGRKALCELTKQMCFSTGLSAGTF